MTDQITVPRATWDAMREALELVHSKLRGNVNGADEHCFTISMKSQISYSQMCRISEALTAANAVSVEQIPRHPLQAYVESYELMSRMANEKGDDVRAYCYHCMAVDIKNNMMPATAAANAVETQFVGCGYYESNGACCESGEPCKADVQNNAVVKPQAQENI